MVPKRSFLSGSTSLRYHRGTRTVDRERRHFLSTQHAQRPAVVASRRVRLRANRLPGPVRGTCCFSCFHCYFYCESVSLGSSVLRYHRAQCIVWVVGPQYKSYACSAPGAGLSINYTRVVHAGRLYTSGHCLLCIVCTLYVCACGITFYIPNYCSLISRTHQSNHQSAY